ncbi:MAG: TonB-dependent receptor [Opitutaceae bacterium]|nr:TonB-dependent receptor [Opitutaceae bacterium]
MQPCTRLLPAGLRRALWPLVAGVFLVTSSLPATAAEAGTGSLTGTVSNTATQNLLEGARIDAPKLGRSVLTDNTGRFVLSGVPVGDVELVVSYLGLDPQRQTVRVTSGQRVVQNFDLSDQVYQLGEFRVTGEREGNALALTAQRNADNVKNVVALDAYGNLPNMSAGELAVRLPGVAPQFDDEGNVTGVFIRGAASTMNRINVDGNLMSNVGGFNRQFQMHSLTGAMFEQLEIIKGQTPEQSPDSLGGTVNLKTRSPLSMKERRRFNYSIGARWAAPFFDHIQERRNHPIHPLTNFAYQEVFDVLGGDHNLGVALNLFYSENVNGPSSRQYDYQNTAASPAYTWDFRTQNQFNNRKQKSINLKAEYRLSERTKLIFNSIFNDAFEKTDRLYATRAFSNQTIATVTNGVPTGTGAVLPGFTDTRTEVRNVAGSNFELSTFLRRFLNRTRLFAGGAEHELDRLTIDYDASYSRTHNNLAHEPGGNLVMRVPNVGWVLDTTDRENPTFTQTSGPSIHDIANYRNSVTLLTRNDDRDIEVFNAKANAAYRLPTAMPATVKGGLFYRDHEMAEVGRRRRWNYLATAPAMTATFADVFAFPGSQRLPFVEPHAAYQDTANPALWSEDLYFHTSDHFSTTRSVNERITAGYIQGQAKFGKLGVLGGIRREKTEVEGSGYVRVRPATAAQIPDPVARAIFDWDHPVTNAGSYSRSFPSVHFTYTITEQLRAQASWSTSFGRPAATNLVPTASISDPAQTVTISNPALGPQYAENIDLSLQYYLRPAGILSVSYFKKDIEDYILTTDVGTLAVGNDNGFEGSYAGYTLRSTTNAGTAKVTGWEFDYRQQLTFLPDWLKGFAVSGNFTMLETEGDFGGTAVRSTNQVPNFVPRSANASLSYSRSRFRFNVLVNYTGNYLATFNAAPQRNVFRKERTIVNTGLSYQWKPSVTFFCDVSNLFNEPQMTYLHLESRPQRIIHAGQSFTFGISGRF